jgi:hypothetical protein
VGDLNYKLKELKITAGNKTKNRPILRHYNLLKKFKGQVVKTPEIKTKKKERAKKKSKTSGDNISESENSKEINNKNVVNISESKNSQEIHVKNVVSNSEPGNEQRIASMQRIIKS